MAFAVITSAQQAQQLLNAWRQAGDDYGPNPVQWSLADAQTYVQTKIIGVYTDSTNTPRGIAVLSPILNYPTPADDVRAPGLRIEEVLIDPTLTVTAATLQTVMAALSTLAKNRGFTRLVGEVWSDSRVWQAFQVFGGYTICAQADRRKPQSGTAGTMLYIQKVV